MPCGTKFLWVLIFVIFAVFSQSAKISSRKFFSRKNLPHCRDYIQKYWFEGKKAIGNLVDIICQVVLLLLLYPSFFCMYHNKKQKCYQFYIIKRDFPKIAKINSQQEKPVFSNRKN